MTDREKPWWEEWMDEVDDWADRVGAFFGAQLERLAQSIRRLKKHST